jgi:aldehyde dehydrogenase (NAD+)
MLDFLEALGIKEENSGVFAGGWIENPGGDTLESISPTNGEVIAKIKMAAPEDLEKAIGSARETFLKWRMMPAPKRGLVVRQMADALREYKKPLGKLVSYEMGKILAEGEGEVQEMIDIADFAVGLSRQLYGKTMHSERPLHRMYEQWHPLGVVGIVTAFNFPVAVWSWNAMIASVCGDTMVWKPSSKSPLTAIAIHNIMKPILERHQVPGLMNMFVGRGSQLGDRFTGDRRIPLISATGSCAMGRRIGQMVSKRLGRCLLELGGNNGIIVTPDADLDLVVPAVVFGAVGTTGQRCTTTRRLFLHEDIYDEVVARLKKAYAQVRIGDSLNPNTLMGPMVDRGGVEMMMAAIETIKKQGGEVIYGGNRIEGEDYPGGCYVEPTLVLAKPDMPIVREETFAPILYIMRYRDLDQALEWHNAVDQGLSSAVFTRDLQSMEAFLSAKGSDCGIANVNVGTSGAEIGGAFGGEKDTGGGREAGSDAWKAYMRRQTCTINWSKEMPLAQGIEFG